MSLYYPAPSPEDVVARWMQVHGFPDAGPIARTVDSGIHVIASRAAAQVSTRRDPVDATDLQRMIDASVSMRGCRLIAFSVSGYSAEAARLAETMNIALLVLREDATVVPVNVWAENLLGTARLQQAPAPVKHGFWRHPAPWYVLSALFIATAVTGLGDLRSGQDVGATIGAVLFCVVLAGLSFRRARELARRRDGWF